LVPNFKRLVSSIAALLVVQNIAGCSLLNPYVRNNALSHDYTRDNPPFAGGLPKAIDDADAQRREYYDAVGDQAELKNGIALSLIPMSAAALYLGITETSTISRDAIAGIGLGGASIFGLGSYLYSEPRQRVYLTGSQAIGCAILSMRAYLVTQTDYDALGQGLALLEAKASDVESDMAAVRALAAGLGGGNPTRIEATALLNLASDRVVRAREVIAAGWQLRGDVDQAGFVLRTKVAAIVDSVSLEVAKTDPDLQALTAIIAGLQENATKFTSVARPATTEKKEGTQAAGASERALRNREADLRYAMSRLREASDDLASATVTVDRFVARAAAVRSKSGDIDQCRVPEADSGFRVFPDVATLDVKPGDTVKFVVTGGTGTPRAALVGLMSSKVTLTTGLEGGNFIATVAIQTGAPAGNAELQLTDATGKSRRSVVLKIAASGGSGSGSDTGGSMPPKPKPAPAPAKPAVNQPDVPGVGTCDAVPEGARGDVEPHLSPDQIRQVQQKLNLATPSGSFDRATRNAIGKYQKDNQYEQTCILNDAQYQRLLGLH
jgi:hypothetical protein